MTETLKFGRVYKVSFERQILDASGKWVNAGEPIFYVSYPLTAQFSVSRNAAGGFNTLDMQIFNLSENTRRQIWQDRSGFDISDGTVGSMHITLYAGYAGSTGTGAIGTQEEVTDKTLPIIFQGRLFEAGSTRRGQDVITYIHATDGSETATATQTFKSYQVSTKTELIAALSKEFKNLDLGAVFNDTGSILPRPVSITGNTYEAIQRYCDNHVYIDLEKLYVLRDIDVINEVEILIDASTGLLETPRRNDSYIELTTLFEPRLTLGQKVKVVSTIQPEYNATYKVLLLKHDCVMSGSIGGMCKTTVGLNTEGKTFARKFNYVAPPEGK